MNQKSSFLRLAGVSAVLVNLLPAAGAWANGTWMDDLRAHLSTCPSSGPCTIVLNSPSSYASPSPTASSSPTQALLLNALLPDHVVVQFPPGDFRVPDGGQILMSAKPGGSTDITFQGSTDSKAPTRIIFKNNETDLYAGYHRSASLWIRGMMEGSDPTARGGNVPFAADQTGADSLQIKAADFCPTAGSPFFKVGDQLQVGDFSVNPGNNAFDFENSEFVTISSIEQQVDSHGKTIDCPIAPVTVHVINALNKVGFLDSYGQDGRVAFKKLTNPLTGLKVQNLQIINEGDDRMLFYLTGTSGAQISANTFVENHCPVAGSSRGGLMVAIFHNASPMISDNVFRTPAGSFCRSVEVGGSPRAQFKTNTINCDVDPKSTTPVQSVGEAWVTFDFGSDYIGVQDNVFNCAAAQGLNSNALFFSDLSHANVSRNTLSSAHDSTTGAGSAISLHGTRDVRVGVSGPNSITGFMDGIGVESALPGSLLTWKKMKSNNGMQLSVPTCVLPSSNVVTKLVNNVSVSIPIPNQTIFCVNHFESSGCSLGDLEPDWNLSPAYDWAGGPGADPDTITDDSKMDSGQTPLPHPCHWIATLYHAGDSNRISQNKTSGNGTNYLYRASSTKTHMVVWNANLYSVSKDDVCNLSDTSDQDGKPLANLLSDSKFKRTGSCR